MRTRACWPRQAAATGTPRQECFVDGLGEEPDDTTIVTAVIGLAHAMGLSVTAEGVETAEQLQILRNMGCQNAQGYLMCRPLPAEDLTGQLTAPVGLRRAYADLEPAA